MKAEFVIRSPGTPDDAMGRLGPELRRHGYSVEAAGPGRLRGTRGSRWLRPFSPRLEDWPTALAATALELDPRETLVILRYEIASGLHLVGALDRAVLEAEAALVEEALGTGKGRTLAEAVARVRRPVLVAASMNMVLAAAVVAFVGVLGGYRAWVVAMVALAVALLDGIVITAFADVILDGARGLPRISGARPVPTAPAPSRGVAD